MRAWARVVCTFICVCSLVSHTLVSVLPLYLPLLYHSPLSTNTVALICTDPWLDCHNCFVQNEVLVIVFRCLYSWDPVVNSPSINDYKSINGWNLINKRYNALVTVTCQKLKSSGVYMSYFVNRGNFLMAALVLQLGYVFK